MSHFTSSWQIEFVCHIVFISWCIALIFHDNFSFFPLSLAVVNCFGFHVNSFKCSLFCLIGLSFLYRNERALWSKTQTRNELKFGRQTFLGQCPPPMWNWQWKEWTLCWSIPSMRPHSKWSTYKKIPMNSIVIGLYKQIDWQMDPQFKTASERSELFADLCCQWDPIQNSKLIRKYQWNLDPPQSIEHRCLEYHYTKQTYRSSPVNQA